MTTFAAEPINPPPVAAHGQPGEQVGVEPTRWAAPVGAGWKHLAFKVLIRALGRWPAYLVAWAVVHWYMLLPSIRQRARPYLRRRFPRRNGVWATYVDSCRLGRCFAETLVDQASHSLLGPNQLTATCPDADSLRALLAEDRGLIVVNAHVGSWQVAMPVLELLATPVSVVMIAPDRDDHRTLGHGLPFTVVDPRRGLPAVVEMVQALGRKEIVGLMGDRTFGDEGNAVTTTFLGGPVRLPCAPYRLASATGAPVAVLLSAKTGRCTYDIRLARVIRPPAGLGRDPAAYAPWVSEFAASLESFVDRHPYQFFNFFDLWAESQG